MILCGAHTALRVCVRECVCFSLTLVGSQADPAAFSSNSIVHLTKVDPCKSLCVVVDSQLPGCAVCNAHRHIQKSNPENNNTSL